MEADTQRDARHGGGTRGKSACRASHAVPTVPGLPRGPPDAPSRLLRCRKPAPRPDHFLALQLSHAPLVVAAVEAVQASLVQHSPQLAKACVEATTAHLTLGVMALGTPQDKQ